MKIEIGDHDARFVEEFLPEAYSITPQAHSALAMVLGAIRKARGESLVNPLPNIPREDQRLSTDKVNHPAHYGGDVPHEAIKCIAAWGLNFNRGNTAKYLCRAQNRPTLDKEMEDLRKARFYLLWEISRVERMIEREAQNLEAKKQAESNIGRESRVGTTDPA